MSEFAGTAYYYDQYRPGIPQDVAELLLAKANARAPATTLLDLGTGTGQVIRALHQHFAHIIAVDPDAEMLGLASEKLRTEVSRQTRLEFFNGRAEDFVPPNGWTASLVTICRAFHWMDQQRVLQRLADFVPTTGLVAVFGDSSFWEATSEWKEATREVIKSFLGEQRRAGSGVFSHHDRPYDEIMRESPFSNVVEFSIPVHRTWDITSIIGYLYSTSFAARPLFGGRAAEFEQALKNTLADYSEGDTFEEDNTFVIRLGRNE
ncbi:MAG: class I SAM-dependent methyltransferase [Thaumarchaeota archaeon]|nr:class I SAM-dependent methyltransferase [Nitrososphaerota archaeon]